MRNRDLLEGMRRDLDVWIKFPERPTGNYIEYIYIIVNNKYWWNYRLMKILFITVKCIFYLMNVLINRRPL